jgi:hypothetical protein
MMSVSVSTRDLRVKTKIARRLPLAVEAREPIKTANGTIRHDHHERCRQMAPRILRGLPL